MRLSGIPTEIGRLAEDGEAQLAARFAEIDRVARGNTKRVMEAFQEFRVSEACVAGTTGYGYDDLGRETLDKIWARVFGAEAALVRTGFVNGTHAIASALFAAVGPGETLMCLLGAPYDTPRTAIGLSGDAYGSLGFYGLTYAEVPPKDGGPAPERPDGKAPHGLGGISPQGIRHEAVPKTPARKYAGKSTPGLHPNKAGAAKLRRPP